MDEILTLPNLSAILYIGLPGCTAGSAAANLLLGRSVPEGRLTQTWARRYSDYPTAREPSCMNDPNEAFYKEGLFVGYRYFDSFGVEPVFAFWIRRKLYAILPFHRRAFLCRAIRYT